MLEYRVPYDVMLEVEGDIRCSLNDDLRPMIARIKRSAVVTAADLGAPLARGTEGDSPLKTRDRAWRQARQRRPAP